MADVFEPAQAADYYDDADIATFYRACWGGENIHIGRYDTGDETVAEAATAVTRHLLDAAGITAGQRVLDLACGYGGTLRMLARMGCHASGIDISPKNVARVRAANAEAGLDDRIDVRVGNYHDVDSADAVWDAVICQEAIIHSNDRPRVFAEAFRILRPGGTFAYTDILTGEDADVSRVEAAYERLGARVGATFGDYVAMARDAGFDVAYSEARPNDARVHYDKLAEALEQPIDGLDDDAVEAISRSIRRWQTAIAHGDITWGCFVAHKPD